VETMLGKGKEDGETIYQKRKGLILQQMAERLAREKDWLCVGIYGDPKTCKTSIALDCVTDDCKVCVLDFDNGCERTWRAAYDCNPNIEIFVPMVFDEYNSVLLDETEEMAETFIRLVDERIKSGEKIKFVFDGLDKWIQMCFDIMTKGKKEYEVRHPPIMWGKRNKKYNDLLDKCLNLKCDRFFVTHMKDKYEGINNPLPVGTTPDWHRTTPGKLSQLIHMKKENSTGINYIAEIINAPNKPELVGKKYTVLTISKDNKVVKWNGIPELRDGTL
jgi:hypothetical protein